MVRQRKRGSKGRGSVFQRKDGRWVAQFIIEETGRQKQLYAATEKEAYARLDQALLEQKQGILATGPQQKLGDYLKWWLDEVHQLKIRPSSYSRYRIALNKHILPELGQIQLRKLTARQVQDFYNKKLKEGQSPSSVHNMHKVLHGGLKRAVQLRYIPYNPSDGVSLPSDEPEREGQFLTLDQAKHLMRVAHGHRLESFIALALTTGMRHGELAALKWNDIDFETGIISVRRTLTIAGSKRVEGSPKTKKSGRSVLLVPAVRDLLDAHKKRQDVLRQESGASWQENDLVFCGPRGMHYDTTGTQRSFYRLLNQAGLPFIHIHDLRHTASTLWDELGVREKVRQELLGHTELEITRNVYTHVTEPMQKDAVERINMMFQ